VAMASAVAGTRPPVAQLSTPIGAGTRPDGRGTRVTAKVAHNPRTFRTTTLDIEQVFTLESAS